MRKFFARLFIFALTFAVGVCVVSRFYFEKPSRVLSEAERKSLFIQKVTGADDEEIAFLFYEMRSNNTQKVNTAKARLLEIYERNPAEKQRVTSQLIKATGKLCHSDGVDVDQTTIMANLLADFQSLEALDVLIDCSNERTSVGGLSYYNYATVPALLSYETKAVPKLKEKLKTAGNDVRCRAATILSAIDKNEAEIALKELISLGTDETVLDCFPSRMMKYENHQEGRNGRGSNASY